MISPHAPAKLCLAHTTSRWRRWDFSMEIGAGSARRLPAERTPTIPMTPNMRSTGTSCREASRILMKASRSSAPISQMTGRSRCLGAGQPSILRRRGLHRPRRAARAGDRPAEAGGMGGQEPPIQPVAVPRAELRVTTDDRGHRSVTLPAAYGGGTIVERPDAIPGRANDATPAEQLRASRASSRTLAGAAEHGTPTEREGFEPSVDRKAHTRFPVVPVQPLRHLSWKGRG